MYLIGRDPIKLVLFNKFHVTETEVIRVYNINVTLVDNKQIKEN